MLLLWLIACALFYMACVVQQTWFRAETPMRPVFYGLEALTCILFLLAGLWTAQPKRTQLDFDAVISTFFGGTVSALTAGIIISFFLRSRHPFHGEWSLFFFLVPVCLLAIVAPAYWIAVVMIGKSKLRADNKTPGI